MFIPGKPLHNETQRHVARMSVRNDDHIEDLDILVRELIDAGLWDKLTLLCVAGPNSADSLLDLKGYQDSSLVGSPAFVADQGFTTVSTTAIIDTGLTLGASYDTDCSMSVYIRNTSAGGSTRFIGERSSGGAVALRDTSTTLVSSLIQVATAGVAIAVAGGGFRMGSRSTTSDLEVAGDESITTALHSAWAWAGATHYAIAVGAINTSAGYGQASANQYAHWSVGHGMTQTEMLTYNSLIKAYFTRRGTAV